MLGGASPHMKAISEGRVAGRIAFQTIDDIPDIKVNEAGSKPVKDGDITG